MDQMIDLLVKDGAKMVIQYGSTVSNPVSSSDIDLFVIYEDSRNRSHFRVGQFDVTRVSTDELNSYISVLDPVYATEPLFTGEVVAGNPNYKNSVIDRIKSVPRSQDVVAYNLQEAVTEYQKSEHHANSNQLTDALQSLSFSLSHWWVARWYAEDHQPQPVTEVLREYDQYEFFRTIREDARIFSSNNTITLSQVETYQNRCLKSFLGLEYNSSASTATPK